MIPVNLYPSKNVIRTRQYPILSLFDEMNRFFEDAVPALGSGKPALKFSPDIDVTDNEKEYVLHGEFPGMDVKDINIELKENTLVLSGEKRSERESKEGDRVYVERSFGSFRRTIPFTVEVDEDNATAEMKNGILTIHIPKSAKVIRGSKKLTIKAA